MEANRNNAAGFTNFGGGTAGPLTPPTLPFRFGRDQDFLVQEQAPPASTPPFRGNTPHARDFRNARSPISSSSSSSNIYRREQVPSPFSNGGVHSFSNANVPRGMSAPRMSSSRPPGLPISGSKSPPLSIEEQQRENEARARRLQRFKIEQAVNPVVETVVPKPEPRRRPTSADSMDTQDGISDDRDWRSAEPILGLCLQMCPEMERSERERKGDLDRFERLEGDRNQTSRELAVKKYTRTPERDPNLIRPLPVLRETMNYLLGLLTRPYSGDLLGLYNFLWDRMRAVRMDLRMQHIFNHEAIEMHEQMIRFHILAMHEFCEYSKGEGFTEGFDAHLNIEQMNKTLVDLFQMYDEHRQQETPALNEAEFRGYYALLKLDKHPGYMVEPAELSADLAKMTSEMRNSLDILFARNVARSCRLPNYVAFFRMARAATYLQACLMHAHFSKLRTQALHSLHSGLKTSQGIPLAQIASWLGMERQEIEELLEYHGFSIKQFEEPYMVKDSVFLNMDQDYHTSKSRLVESKRSSKVSHDVVARKEARDWFPDRIQVEPVGSKVIPSIPKVVEIVDEEIPDYEEEVQNAAPERSENTVKPLQMFSAGQALPAAAEVPTPTIEKPTQVSILPMQQSVSPVRGTQNLLGKRQRHPDSDIDHAPKRHEPARAATILADMRAEEEKKRMEEKRLHQAQASNGKAKFWFRRWKRRTDAKVEAAKLRHEKALAALASMSAGFTFLTTRKDSAAGTQTIDLSSTTVQRKHILDNMWGYLDVPSLISRAFKAKYPQDSAICWKLAFFSGVQQQHRSEAHQASSTVAGHWLRSKLFDEDPKFGKRSAYTSLAETFVSKNLVDDVYCCYIAKDVGFDGTRLKSAASLYGISAILFLLREDLPLEDSCSKLHSLVDALPSGAGLPLLVLSLPEDVDMGYRGLTEVLETRLELNRLDRTKVSSWSVVPMTEGSGNSRGFFSTKALVSGIEWLAALAPAQPVLRSVNLRDLVGEHLQRSLKVWIQHHAEIGPQACISLFNQALRDCAEELRSSARGSRSNWPPPEFGRAPDDWVGCCLPNAGWNEAANLQPIFDALECSRLPFFSTDNWQLVMSRSRLGDGLLDEVNGQYKSVKDNLAGYLKDIDDNISQAQTLVEGSALLDWSEAECSIVIDWVRVFRGIFQNRLMLLNSEPPAIVYVLRKAVQDEDGDYEKKLKLASKLRHRIHQNQTQEVTDSMEVVCSTLVPQRKIEETTELEEELDSIVAKELLYARSEEHRQSLLRIEESVGNRNRYNLSPTSEVSKLDSLVNQAHGKLDRNLSKAETGSTVIEARLIRPVMPGGGSPSHAGKKFADLLSCCERLQLSNGSKLADYFGLAAVS